MTDEFLNTFGRIDRPNPTRNRNMPLISTPDRRPSDWLAVLTVFGLGSAFFFLLGLGGYVALRLL